MEGESGDPRAELAGLIAEIRTNLGLRKRSGLAGVPGTRTARHTTATTTAFTTTSTATTTARSTATAASTIANVVAAEPIEVDEAGRKVGGAGLALVREDLGDCRRCA